MLVKFKAVVSKVPSVNKFDEGKIDINCYSAEDRIYVGITAPDEEFHSEDIHEGDTLIVTGILSFNRSKDGSKTYYNVKKVKDIKNLGQLTDELEF